GLKTPLALFFSSFVFGLGHIGNPDFNWAAALGIAAAGLFMAFAYLRTRQLWLPIGLHIGWNIFEGPIFGFPVSGLETVRLLNHQVNGPTLITGGAFGPEAGLVVLPAIVIGALMVYWYTRKPYKEKDA
ncbi:MAG: CPBP family intramembrane metalloprotease, partial [Anaerolineales bacterium]